MVIPSLVSFFFFNLNSTTLSTTFCVSGTLFLNFFRLFMLLLFLQGAFSALLTYLAFISILSCLAQFLIFVFSPLLLLKPFIYSHLSEDFNANHTQCIYFTDIWDLLICLLDLAYPLLLSVTFHQGFISLS